MHEPNDGSTTPHSRTAATLSTTHFGHTSRYFNNNKVFSQRFAAELGSQTCWFNFKINTYDCKSIDSRHCTCSKGVVVQLGESFTNDDDLPTDTLMPDLEDTIDLLNTGIFSGVYDDEDEGVEADLKNLKQQGNVMQRDDGIFISQDKYVVDILKKFDFVTMKTSNTPIETHKALLKDEEAENVDVYLYRSMIRSLMYLTASRPDIMFVVCVCARFQVTPKVSHLHDYTGASLDRKSTIGGCQFLGKRLILWQCKKQTIVANSTTEAEYVAATNCCGQRQRISRVREEASSFNIEEWEDIQATIEADEELAQRIQAEEIEKYSKAERARLLAKLINQRKRYFAQQRAKERRNKPLTQAQQRTYMPNYIKHIGSHTLQQLKRLSFDELKALFETTMRRVQTFHPIESEGDKIVPELTIGSSKRDAEVELDHEGSKKQKTNEALGSVQEQP
ncbi:hypothetical protein Tco_0795472 [Tanacetum coccineum]